MASVSFLDEGASAQALPREERAASRSLRGSDGEEGLAALLPALEALEGSSLDGFMAVEPERDAAGAITDFRWLYLNPAVEQLLGRAEGELRGRLLLVEMPCYRESDLFRACVRVMSTGEPEALELRDAAEEERWLRISLARCQTGLTVRLLDISAQKQAEQELLDRELMYRLVSQATNDVLWDWDVDRGLIRWGEAIYTVLGYRRDEVRGSLAWWAERLHPEDRERVVHGLDEILTDAETEAWSDEYRFRRADGTYAFYFDRGFAIRDARGKVHRMLGSMVDLTDRVRAEEALLESEERFRAIFTQAAVGMALVSPAGAWLKCNQRLCDIVGYPCEELVGKTLEDVTFPEDAQGAMRQLQRVLAGELKSHTAELRAVCKNGDVVWINLTISLVREVSGAARWFVAVVEDIHQRKRLEEEARRAQAFEAQLHGIVGHDIRSPLAAIKATVSQLLAKPDLPEPMHKAVARIARSTERIQRLVQQLLDYTRIRVGDGIPVHPKPTDLNEVCRRVVEEFSQTHPGRALEFRGAANGVGEWDPDRLMQLVSNLVENALKYGAAHTPVTIQLRDEGETAVLEVHNEGEPIPPSLLPTLFEPFRRGPQNEQTVKVSLGLGLYVVREVVRAHGGMVEVRSDRESGTTISVHLPRHPHSEHVDGDGPAPTLH